MSEARIHLSWWHFWDVWTKRRDPNILHTAERLAREAQGMDPRDARLDLLVGIALFMTKRTSQARVSLQTAISLNPSLASGYACLGSSFILDGLAEKAVSPLRLSIWLNPHDPFMFHYLGELAIAFHMQKDWETACSFAERSLQLRPGYWYARAILIASLVRGGETAKAKAVASERGGAFFRQNKLTGCLFWTANGIGICGRVLNWLGAWLRSARSTLVKKPARDDFWWSGR